MTDNKKSSATVMSDAEIINALEHCSQHKCDCKCPKYYDTTDVDICRTHLIRSSLDFINRLQVEKEALIAGQETLQKALAEKNAEIERLTNLCQEQNIEIKRLIETKNRLLYNLKTVCKEKDEEAVKAEAEVERLNEWVNYLNKECCELAEKPETAKAEAIKEFWSRLQGIAYRSEVEWSHGEHPMLIELDDAEEIYEEMVGENT